MERIAHKAHGFGEARAWEIAQLAAMTPDESRQVAKALRDRVYGTDCPDVRDAVAGVRRRRRDLTAIHRRRGSANARPRKRR